MADNIITRCIDRLRRMLGGDSGGGGGGGGGGGSGQQPITAYVGITDAQIARYAEYLEMGWAQVVTPAQAGWLHAHGVHKQPGTVLVMPPRPSFGVAAERNRERWRRIAQNMARRQMPHLDVRAIAVMVGQVARDDVKTQIATADGMEPRSPATLAIYASEMRASGRSARGTAGMTQTKPLVKTGAFLAHVDFELRDGL